MVVLDLIDSSWWALMVVAALAISAGLLFWSLRSHLRRIDVPDDHPDEGGPS